MSFSYLSDVKATHEIICFISKIFLKYSHSFTSKILKNFVDKNEHDTTTLKCTILRRRDVEYVEDRISDNLSILVEFVLSPF